MLALYFLVRQALVALDHVRDARRDVGPRSAPWKWFVAGDASRHSFDVVNRITSQGVEWQSSRLRLDRLAVRKRELALWAGNSEVQLEEPSMQLHHGLIYLISAPQFRPWLLGRDAGYHRPTSVRTMDLAGLRSKNTSEAAVTSALAHECCSGLVRHCWLPE